MNLSGGGFQDSAPRVEYTGIKTLRALTAKQLESLNVGDSTSIHVIDNAEISYLAMVGYADSVHTSGTGIMFTLNDTTGAVGCVLWANSGYEHSLAERIRDGNLLCVTGSLKIFNAKKSVNVNTVTIVPTNYLVYHLTTALYQSLFFQRRIELPSTSVGPQGSSNVVQGGMPVINSDVLEAYRNNQDDNGLELDLVITMLQSKYKPSQIQDAINYLLENCDLYSVDGTHYKTTL